MEKYKGTEATAERDCRGVRRVCACGSPGGGAGAPRRSGRAGGGRPRRRRKPLWWPVRTVRGRGVVDTSGAFADERFERIVVGVVRAQHEDIFADVLVERVVAPLVADVAVEVVDLGIDGPLVVPELGDGHADIHHPAQAGDGIVAVLAGAVGDVGRGDGLPAVVDVGAGLEDTVDLALGAEVLVEIVGNLFFEWDLRHGEFFFGGGGMGK